MMFGTAGVSSGEFTPPEFVGYDDFSGTSLNTEKWTAYKGGVSSSTATVVVDGRLKLGIPAGYATAAVRSVSAIATTGTFEVEFKWTPGYYKDLSTGGCPYVAITSSTPTRYAYVGNAYACFGVQFGRAYENAGTYRSRIGIGYFTQYQNTIEGTDHIHTFTEGTEYLIKFVINWTTRKLALYVDGSVVLSDISMSSYGSSVPAGPMYLEVANSGAFVSGQLSTEIFDNLSMTVSS